MGKQLTIVNSLPWEPGSVSLKTNLISAETNYTIAERLLGTSEHHYRCMSLTRGGCYTSKYMVKGIR